MSTRPYPLRLPEGILQLAELRGHDERTDKSTVLRQWLYAAAEAYALRRLAEGHLTMSQTAAFLDVSLYEVQRKAQDQGLEIGATAVHYQQAAETVRHWRRQTETSGA